MGPGDTLDRYRIEAALGQGGWGHVYRAVDTRLRRKVALKVLRADRVADAPRFLREARAVASLQHPNVVAVYDLGEADGQTYIAMELVEGRLLSELAGPRAPATAADKLKWLIGIARGLHASHLAGLLHRDVKPQNVIVSEGGEAKLLDFGLAKPTDEAHRVALDGTLATRNLTRVGHVVGSPLYMSPEALGGGECDGRADQFSWGVTAYEVLSGINPRAPMMASNRPPPLLSETVPGVRHEVAVAIARTLATDRAQRFPDMAALVAALEAAPVGPADALPATEKAPEVAPDRAGIVTQKVAPATRRDGQDPRASPAPPKAAAARPAVAPTLVSAPRAGVGRTPLPFPEARSNAARAPAPERSASPGRKKGSNDTKLALIGAAAAVVAVGLVASVVALAWRGHTQGASAEVSEGGVAAKGTGCAKDTDCKGNRICERGACVSPPPAPSLTTLALPAPLATASAHEGDAADKERQTWLVDGAVLARDNPMEPLRTARIAAGLPAKLTFAGQFGFRCSLTFGDDGRPGRLSECTSRSWAFAADVILLHCTVDRLRELCTGSSGGIGPPGLPPDPHLDGVVIERPLVREPSPQPEDPDNPFDPRPR